MRPAGVSTKRNDWKEWEDRVLKSLYPRTPARHITTLLDRSFAAIKNRAATLGLKKDPDVTNDGRFQKGITPWNKGKNHPSSGRSSETQFKRGSKPANWLPVGSERITKDGYLQRKMTDTGAPNRDFVPVHHLVWIEHTGRKVPRGHALIFKDGNKQNFSITNLELLTRAQLMLRNSITTLPPDVREQVRLVGGFNRRLRRIERDRNSREPTQNIE